MITAAHIKKANVEILDALDQALLGMVDLRGLRPAQPLKLNFYQCLNTLLEVLQDYCRAPQDVPLHLHLLDWHARRYSTDT